VPRSDNQQNPTSRLGAAWAGLRKPVFVPASLIIVALLVFAVVYGGTAEDAFTELNSRIADAVGWWYILATTGFVGFAIFCAVTRIGNIKLGRDGEEPEFGVVPWFAMLFSAGMGIGLVFYGVAEPLTHYVKPPDAGGVPGSTDAAGYQAMQLTMFHWGLHAWSIYIVVGLGLAYMTFRRGRPLAVRWLLEPLLGRARVEGPIGHAIDTIAIVGTLFGIATSLGFGVQQIMAGLSYLGWIEPSNLWIVLLVALVTVLAVFSVVSGVHKGLKWLSNINMGLAATLALFVLVVGPTLFLVQSWVQNIGAYIQAFPELMLRTAPLSEDGWASAWTIFYWGWWISWAPFVGMFIARISRGRTIREFVTGVLLAPVLVSSLWFTIFGDTAILRQRTEGDLAGADGSVNADTTLFALFETLPLSVVSSVLAIMVVVFFFVTSADSGSLVIDILATGGSVETPRITRVYWSVLAGAAGATLLIIGGSGSLTTLQTASIATAVPFSIVMVLACVALLRAFRYEVAAAPRYLQVRPSGRPRAGWRSVSATLVGLEDHPERDLPATSDSVVFTVKSLTSADVAINEKTGAVTVDTDSAPRDPLAGEVFDTPEFEQSHEATRNAADEQSP
jgi:choline/glycine/proline betaine transport protein